MNVVGNFHPYSLLQKDPLLVDSVIKKLIEQGIKLVIRVGELISKYFFHVVLLIYFLAFWFYRLEMCFKKLYTMKLFR